MIKRLALIVVALLALYAVFRAGERHQRDELPTVESNGETISRVVAITFRNKSELNVRTARGTVQTVVDDDSYFDTRQVSKAPFTVNYFVDLSKLNRNSFRWDEKSRSLFVIVPDIRVASPDVDEGNRSYVSTTGMWVSRGAGERLGRSSAAAAKTTAAREAGKPINIVKAQNAARKAVADLLRAPLQVAGVDISQVNVVFASDAPVNSEQWDSSRSLAEIFSGENVSAATR